MKRLALLLSLPFLTAATTPTIVKWSASNARITPAKSGAGVIRVRATIVKGWHVYALTQKGLGPKPLAFELDGKQSFALGAPKGPVPQKAYDAEFGTETATYSGSPEFLIPVRALGASRAGKTDLHLVVRYQACSDNLCLPPRKEALTVTVDRAPGA